MNLKKKNLCGVLALILSGAVLLAGCQADDASAPEEEAHDQIVEASESGENGEEELLSGLHHVEIKIKDLGTISVELDADHAPITVTNFVKLAESGFYDGLTFHRIMKDFMMQGGDPEGTGMGGSDTEIKGEFAANGVENPLSHTRGAISMARSNRMDSASSQFFIVHQDSTYLDGQYACFGYVTDGMDIVDQICENTTGQDANGIVPVENRPVIESIVVVD